MRQATRPDVAQFVTLAPDRAKHAEPMIDLIAKALPWGPGFYGLRDRCRYVYLLPAHYDWEASRIGLVGDHPVTHFGVWDFQMRIGSARIRAGGIGAVVTDEDYRRRGLMARTARACLEAMRAKGYDVSVLFGIEGFYRQFGYVRAWSDAAYVVPLGDLPGEPPASPVTRFAPRPRADLADLYNRSHETATGSAARPTYHRANNPWTDLPIGYRWGKAGRLEGYVLLDRRGGEVVCGECCGEPAEVLRVLATLGRRWHTHAVRFESLPANTPLARLLQRGTCRVEVQHRRSGGPLIVLLNLRSALTKMEEELTRRLRASRLADWTGRLVIGNGQEQAALAIGSGKVRVADARASRHSVTGGDEVVQLLLGTAAPGEVVEAAGMRLTGEAGPLLEALFPEQYPVLGGPDRF